MGSTPLVRWNPDGLSRQERVVLTLWDDAFSIERIATLLDLSRKRVSSIVSYLNGPTEQREAEAAMRQASAAFLIALGAQ